MTRERPEADWISEMYGADASNSPQLERTASGDAVRYRPVGQKELELIAATEFTRFPPRLAQQPIFYPVLNREYARQIASRWNTNDAASGHRGYATRFVVSSGFLGNREVHQVGGSIHQEYWIPAEELDEFNGAILGRIEVIDSYAPDEAPND